MRRLVWLILILAVVWCLWWMAASVGMQLSVTNWFEDRRSAGWRAEVVDVSQHGFPLTLHARLRDMSVADPTTGVSVDAPQIDLIAAAYWPGFVTVKLPKAPVEITTPAGRFSLQTKDAQADLRLHPGAALQLQSMGVVSDAWQVLAADGGLVAADDLRVEIVQDDTSPETYQFDIIASNLTPGDLIRTFLALPIDWPLAFDAFDADLSVAFDVPWDRSALTQKRPQPRAVTLRRLEATWGEIGILSSGTLTIDSSGIPTGEVSVAITNWRKIIAMAEASGALLSAQRAQAEIMLSALANLDGGTDDLDLTLTFLNGDMSLGPIRLGPAPRLILD